MKSVSKKIVIIASIVAGVVLVGLIIGVVLLWPSITKVNNESFNYNDESNLYTLKFSLINKHNISVTDDFKLDILIANDLGDTLFKKEYKFTDDDFIIDESSNYYFILNIDRNELSKSDINSGVFNYSLETSTNKFEYSNKFVISNNLPMYEHDINDPIINLVNAYDVVQLVEWADDTSCIYQITNHYYHYYKNESTAIVKLYGTISPKSSVIQLVLPFTLYDEDGKYIESGFGYVQSKSDIVQTGEIFSFKNLTIKLENIEQNKKYNIEFYPYYYKD